MHEMALTESIVELIEEESRKQGFSRVRVGAARDRRAEPCGAGSDPLLLRGGGAWRNRRRRAARHFATPGEGWCLDCAKTVDVEERFGPCPECGGYHVQVTGGEDMRVQELEVD